MWILEDSSKTECIVVIDAHSKWPEVIEMMNTTTQKTKTELQQLFFMYGLRAHLVSDSSQFTSEECVSFMKKKRVKHILLCSLPFRPLIKMPNILYRPLSKL